MILAFDFISPRLRMMLLPRDALMSPNIKKMAWQRVSETKSDGAGATSLLPVREAMACDSHVFIAIQELKFVHSVQ